MFVIPQMIHELKVNDNHGNLRLQHMQRGTLLTIDRPYVIWTQVVADWQGRAHQT